MLCRRTVLSPIPVLAALATLTCADWDNPAALTELSPEVEFELSAAEIETFQEIEVHVHVHEGGSPMSMGDAQLEIQHADGGAVRTVSMESAGDGYAAHVMFFEPGDHHIHLMGIPHRHTITWEVGEHEVHVHRLHTTAGPFWLELAATPSPVLEQATAHVRVLVFELLPDGTKGMPVGGVTLSVEVHTPSGGETVLTATEEGAGEYEFQYAFGTAGTYELHVRIAGEPAAAAFHFPVLTPDTGNENGGTGGHDDGHDH